MRVGCRRLGFPRGFYFRQDAGPQRVRSGAVEAALHDSAGAGDIGGGSPADRTARLVYREPSGVGGVQLSVQLCLYQQDLVAVQWRGHAFSPSSTARARTWRARNRRDITVLIGVCVISAISL